MNKNVTLLRCDICNITMPDSNVLEFHFTGRKHLKAVRNLDLRAQQEGKAVYITKLGELRLPEIHSYMSTFGTVVNMAVGANRDIPGRLHHVIVEFESEEVVQVILARNLRNKHEIVIPGSDPPKSQLIKIYERKFKEQRQRSPSPSPCSSVSHDQVKLRLSVIEDCEEQLEELVSLTHLSQEDVDLRINICKNMQKTFSRTEFSNCVVYPFGSSVSGLGFPGCDLDIFLDLGVSHHLGSPNSNLMNDIPITMTEQQKVKAALKVLKDIPQCARLTPILGARVPILKFIHRPTGIHCDISFKNRASVRNTEYIRFCMEADSRIRSVMVTVRYLTRHYGLCGGGGGLKMSNYALTMFVILYLQQLENPLLHPVMELQSYEGQEKDIISGWNCNFCQEFDKLRLLPVNNSTSLELVGGFLQFFSQLDFANVVLCPLLGKVMSKTEFQSNKTVSTNYLFHPPSSAHNGLQTDRPMCLQDPFELSHNVCRNLPDKAVKILKIYMKEAASVAANLLIPETRPLGGLKAIFDLEVNLNDIKSENDLGDLLDLLDDGKKTYFVHNFKILLDKNFIFWFNKESGGKEVEDENLEKVLSVDMLLDSVAYLTEVALGNCLRMIKQDIDVESVKKRYDNTIEINDTATINDEDTEILNVMDESISSLVEDGNESASKDSGVKRPSTHGDSARPRKRSRQEDPLGYRVVAEWTVWSQVWAGRRKLSASMENEKENMSTVAWEALISSKLSEGEFKLQEPEVAFRVHMLAKVGSESGCVMVGFQKVMSRKKAYESLASWLCSYLPDVMSRLVKEKVVEGVAEPLACNN